MVSTLVIWSLFCFFLGAVSYYFFRAKLIRVLPKKGLLDIQAFFSQTLIQEGEATTEADVSLVITLKNIGTTPIYLEAWFLRCLNGQGFLQQFFLAPQNFTATLEAGEKTTIEVQDLTFLENEKLHTIVIRDIYGREWELNAEQIKTLKKNYFWSSL